MGALFTDLPIKSLHRGSEVIDKISIALNQYQNLRTELKILAEDQKSALLKFFIFSARTNIWVID